MIDVPLQGAAPASAAATPRYSDRYRNLVVILLSAAYAVNFIDRTIIVTIGQAIKVDLKITDTQLGLLGGLYFALLYSILGVPIARLADRFNRVNILVVSMLVWSGFTALCGSATNFLMLSIYRFGVGTGEAGLHPPAHSLISDYFPKGKRARALGIFAVGVPIGTMAGAMLGGWLTQNFSWRIAFFIVGLPGIILAIVIKLVMKEPPRGYADMDLEAEAAGDEVVAARVAPAADPKGLTFKEDMAELWSCTKFMFGNWPLLHTMLAVGLGAFTAFGAGQFHAAYFIRAFHLNYAQVGALLGLLGGVAGITGSYMGGWLSDRLGARIDPRFYPIIPGVGFLIAFPLAMMIYHAPSWKEAALILAFPGMFSGTYLASTFAIVQNAAPVRQRATAAAIMLLMMNLIGMGGGPVFTGWLIDHLAAFHLAHPGDIGAWQSVTHAFDPSLPSFQQACPGGMGRHSAGSGVSSACSAALVLGTRQGIVLTYCVWFWAAAHYFIAAAGMRKVIAPTPKPA